MFKEIMRDKNKFKFIYEVSGNSKQEDNKMKRPLQTLKQEQNHKRTPKVKEKLEMKNLGSQITFSEENLTNEMQDMENKLLACKIRQKKWIVQ